MANFATLKAAINAVIKTNGNKEITGEVLNQVLNAMVTSLGANYQFAGVATPSTNPGTPDQNVFYMATEAGTYTNFNATVLPAGISILLWNGSWSHETFFEIDSVPTSGSDNLISSGAVFEKMKLDGGAYDVSAHNEGATFASLSALLSSENLNTLIPVDVRHGGMSIKFVQTSDNNYVQYMLNAQSWTIDLHYWEKVNLSEELRQLDEKLIIFTNVTSEYESQIVTNTQSYGQVGNQIQFESNNWKYIKLPANISWKVTIQQYSVSSKALIRYVDNNGVVLAWDGIDQEESTLKSYVLNPPVGAVWCYVNSISNPIIYRGESFNPNNIHTDADKVNFVPESSGMSAENVQDAIIENRADINVVKGLWYPILNTTSQYPIISGTQVYGQVGNPISYESFPSSSWGYLVIPHTSKHLKITLQAAFSPQALIFYTDENNIIIARDALRVPIDTPVTYDINFPSGAFKCFATFTKNNVLIKEYLSYSPKEVAETFPDEFTEEVKTYFGVLEQGFTIFGNDSERWESAYSKLIKRDGELVSIDSTLTISIACYTNQFVYIGSYTQLSDINADNVAYIRIVVTGLSDVIVPPNVQVTFKNTSRKLKICYEPLIQSSGVSVRRPFTCTVGMPMDNPAEALDDVDNKVYTNGYISLAENYTQEGSASKCIILCTGTTGAPWDSINSAYTERITYFNKMGYSVIIVNACSSKYKTSVRTNAATPLGIACFEAASEYAREMYNIDDNFYLYAKSAGGITAMNIINSSSIQVKCAAIHAPNLDAFNDFRCSAPNVSVNYFSQLNLPYSNSWDATELAAIKQNQDEFDGYNPFTFCSTINKKAYNDLVLDNAYPLSASSYPDSDMKDYSDDFLLGTDMQAIVASAKVFLRKPIKIWYAEDDEQVPYGTIVNFAKMVANAGCLCKLRKMADGTGGHRSMDVNNVSPEAIQSIAPWITKDTKYGGQMTIALGVAEVVQWFEIY